MNKLLSTILIAIMNTAFFADCVTHDNACESKHKQKEMYSHPCTIIVYSKNNAELSVAPLRNINDNLKACVYKLSIKNSDIAARYMINVSSAEYIADDKEENKIRTAKICDITLNDQYKVELFTEYGRTFQQPIIRYCNAQNIYSASYNHSNRNVIMMLDEMSMCSHIINADALLKYIQDREQSENVLTKSFKEQALQVDC